MSLSALENQAIGLLSAMSERTPENIRMTLRTVLTLFPDVRQTITEQQLEECAKLIETKLFVRMNDAASVQLEFEKWLPQRRTGATMFYYDRYRNWLARCGFVNSVLGVLDNDTDKVVGLLEDPSRKGGWKRRGLIVGHVQSGKTANYTGVICKAADFGYRFIVVLTGMQEDLRAQTQTRLEEGFVGISSESSSIGDSRVGVGFWGMDRRPMVLTSRADDFKSSAAKLTVPIQSLSEPLILVMKKNSRILANLIEWLKTKSPEGSGRISGVPMLLIDDEADNASVNTSSDADSPTSINGRIRELLELFDKNAYVGYTATPFANIFIDPESVDAWEREDLFPRDFIVSLDAPTNYVGASRIFAEDGDLASSLIEIEDHSKLIPEKHPISLKVPALPESLVEAVSTFILCRAIRCARGHGKNHSSMLVNVSRFNAVQTQVTGLISDYLNRIRIACHGHAMLPERIALGEPLIRSLHTLWLQQFDGRVEETWKDIQPVLIEASGPVEVRKINSKSADSLDYRRYKENGLHVIAVGGLALSRGFTLEGLTVSYFLRNSIMYDTLLQMGRWFGYRDGYADVCRVYMTPDAIGWYRHISSAIDELRDELRRMERADKSPRDFGLRVRSHPDSLIVTARNKMRSGKQIRHRVDLAGRAIETTALRTDALKSNSVLMSTLLAKLVAGNRYELQEGLGYVWHEVSADVVRNFVASFRNHNDACMKTQAEPVCAYITARDRDELRLWDVCLYSSPKAEGGVSEIAGLTVVRQMRTATWHEGLIPYVSVGGASSRLASRGAERAGMDSKEIAIAEDAFSMAGDSGGGRSIPDKAYRYKRKRPLLMLHLINAREDEKSLTARSAEVTAWGISFPSSDNKATEVEYVVNTTWWSENYPDELAEQDEEDTGNA